MSYTHPGSMRGHVAIITGQTIHVDGGIGTFR